METRLCYNGTDRLFEVRLGLRVLSAHPNKEQALVAQLAGEAPQALELAQSLIAVHPELMERALKAVILVADGAVQIGAAPGQYQVRSQQKNGEEVYDIDLEHSTCTCVDWEHRAPMVGSRKLCKHLLACLIVRKLGVAARKPPIRTEVMHHDRP